jgi:hypothetical protein
MAEKKLGSFLEDFTKEFEAGLKKAGTAHRNKLEKPPKYDLDVIQSGQGGFTEPSDAGIRL